MVSWITPKRQCLRKVPSPYDFAAEVPTPNNRVHQCTQVESPNGSPSADTRSPVSTTAASPATAPRYHAQIRLAPLAVRQPCLSSQRLIDRRKFLRYQPHPCHTQILSRKRPRILKRSLCRRAHPRLRSIAVALVEGAGRGIAESTDSLFIPRRMSRLDRKPSRWFCR